MFRFKSLELVHWDYWERIRIPLDVLIVTIVGPNGSGKTTLLDAFRTILAINCSSKRDYKAYLRHNKKPYAWLKATVSNERVGSSRPPFFPILATEVTLACRIQKDGGDWKKQYMIAEGDVSVEDLSSRGDWIGRGEYERRLQSAGLSPAIRRVLALEQGQTDKLCEYSPKALLDLVFDVFGDKEVLDQYQNAKSEQRELDRELREFELQLKGNELELEKLIQQVERFREWQRLDSESTELREHLLPCLRILEYRDGIDNGRRPIQGLRKDIGQLHREQDEILGKQVNLATEQSANESEKKEVAKQRSNLHKEFGKLREQVGSCQALLSEETRLQTLASESEDHDAAATAADLAFAREKQVEDRLTFKNLQGDIERLQHELNHLKSGKVFQPAFLSDFRAQLSAAKVAHSTLSDIIEIKDPRWQFACESLLKPYRHLILLDDPNHRETAWRLGEQMRFRQFVVSDRDDVDQVNSNSLRAIVDFTSPPPFWLSRLLNEIMRVESVESGAKLGPSRSWITPQGYHRESRGGRYLGIENKDYHFGVAGRKAKAAFNEAEINRLGSEAEALKLGIAKRELEISKLQGLLDGQDAAKQLAARSGEFAEAKDAVAKLEAKGIELTDAILERDQQYDQLEEAIRKLEGRLASDKARTEAISRELREKVPQLDSRRKAHVELIINFRAERARLKAPYSSEAALKAKGKYKSAEQAELRLNDIEGRLQSGSWIRDASVIVRQKKMEAETQILKDDVERRKANLERAKDLTMRARGDYINVLKATIRRYAANIRSLGETAGIEIEVKHPEIENDDVSLAQASLDIRFNFDSKGMIGLDDGEASGGQQVMKSLILLIGLMMDESGKGGFVFIDEPFAHLDIFNIAKVGNFLKATHSQYVITTPITHNSNVYDPSYLTIATQKKKPGFPWAPPLAIIRRRQITEGNVELV